LKNFEELGISPGFVKGLTELNIIEPTDIQKKVIPVLMAGATDIVAQAQTGTGKNSGIWTSFVGANGRKHWFRSGLSTLSNT